ncbi:MAG: hypothetical protein WD749_08645 [Phycisphaerales bacterium]
MRRVVALFAALALSAAASAFPITYQGVLNSAGAPANGSFSITFQLTDSAVGGFLLQSIAMPAVNVVNGQFTVELNFADSHFNGQDRWLTIVVNGTSLTPRQRVSYAPYAVYSDRAREAGTVRVPLTLTGATVVIEGFASAAAGVGVRGVHLAGTGTEPGVLGQSNSSSASAAAVLGEITPGSGGSFSAGVRGINNSTTGNGVGVYGSQEGSGWGVYGVAPAAIGVFGSSGTGIGARGFSSSGTGVEGVSGNGVGVNAASSGLGLVAENTASDTLVELGTADYAVRATNLAVEGLGTAIYGRGGSTGILGEAAPEGFGNLSRYGVRGFAGGFSTGAQHLYGVSGFGQAPAFAGNRFAYGVAGGAQSGASTNIGYGIFGESVGPGTNFAGYFQGNVHVLGTLTKSSGAFKIDHPQDPENKYLSHSFVESPEMLNIYSGVAVLDGEGRAVVSLPAYFETLNASFRYQLTAIGAPMRDLHVAAEVSGNTFAIGGGAAGGKVSWQVSGVRQDPAAKYHAIRVEEEKPEAHRGKFLNPEAFGADRSRGIHAGPSLED